MQMEEEFGTLTRGKKHTVPKKEADVRRLVDSYQGAGIHVHEPGRTIRKREQATDYSLKGCLRLQRGGTISRWVDGRSFGRATSQEWVASDDSDNSDEST